MKPKPKKQPAKKKKKGPKKPPTRGAVVEFLSFGKRLRNAAEASPDATKADVLHTVADAAVAPNGY